MLWSCVNDFPRVATHQCGGREFNSRPVDWKSGVRTITLPSLKFSLEKMWDNLPWVKLEKLFRVLEKVEWKWRPVKIILSICFDLKKLLIVKVSAHSLECYCFRQFLITSELLSCHVFLFCQFCWYCIKKFPICDQHVKCYNISL